MATPDTPIFVKRPLPRDRRIRTALVGCGRISKSHLDALAAHKADTELVAVCDADPKALAAAQELTGAPGYPSLDALLAKADADLVVLATPSGLHPAQAIQAAQAGRHVMTEKPMATRWDDGKRMVEVCDKAGVQLFVVKQNRLNPTVRLVKRALARHRFGRIYAVTCNVFWTRPQEYYDAAKWRGTWEFDGGAFMNQASHYVDLLEWLIGPVESVFAYTATLARRIEVEDTGVAAIRWRNGAMGSINVTMCTYPKNLEGSLTILGEKGTVRLGGVAVNKIEHWEFAEPDAEDDAKWQEASYQPSSIYGQGHVLYYDNVIKALRGEEPAQTDGREGLRSLELLVAIYESARDGRRVGLPLQY
jgi:UDP-N-acetyl-2-amino-2-deoxyglucuronate dehydrogenase